jgi:hypothetical protein
VSKSAAYLAKKRENLKTLRQPWDSQFDILGQYVYQRKTQFSSEISPGAFLNDGSINDSTASRALQAMASAIMGSLWKTGGRTFRLEAPSYLAKSAENKKYYEDITKVLSGCMETEKAGFELAFHETLCEEGVFGTGTFCIFQGDYKTPLIFKSWALQSLYLAESKDEFIDTLYYDQKLTVEQVANTYGVENVSADVKKKYGEDKSKFDMVLICVAIEPRNSLERAAAPASSNLALPYASYHFEVEKPHLLKESGYADIPAKSSRWYKLPGEVYGRSPAMDAIPAIMQLNALKEAFLIGAEKKVEPPLYVLDDGSLGAAAVDTSAGGLSVLNMSGRLQGQNPIGVIFDVGELQSVSKIIEDTKGEVLQHFLIDKLYDLNNKTRMTLGEAEIRYDIRADALSATYARIFNEQLTPAIERSFNITFEMGLLGVAKDDVAKQELLKKNGIDPIIIPPEIVEAMAKGRDVYKISYISPAAQLLRESERRGVTDTVNAMLTISSVSEDAVDTMDIDETMEAIRDLSGAPSKIMRAVDEANSRRRARNDMRRQAMEAEKAKVETEAARNIGQAQNAVAAAGQPRIR